MHISLAYKGEKTAFSKINSSHFFDYKYYPIGVMNTKATFQPGSSSNKCLSRCTPKNTLILGLREHIKEVPCNRNIKQKVISTSTQKKKDCKSDINMISNVSRPIEMNLYIVIYVSF